MRHYFTKNSDIISNKKEISVTIKEQKFRFITDHGVFSKDKIDYGSMLLLKTILPLVKGKILDYGCGYGFIGICLSVLLELEVELIDINDRAMNLSKENIIKNNSSAKVVNKLSTYDNIILNPPIRSGKKNIYSMYKKAFESLRDNGSLYIVIQKKQGLKSTIKELSYFSSIETLNRSNGYHVIKASLYNESSF